VTLGLNYAQQRWQDPRSGTWLSEDPSGIDLANPTSINAWLYASANPLKWTDPGGDVPKDTAPESIRSAVGNIHYKEIERAQDDALRGYLVEHDDYWGQLDMRLDLPGYPIVHVHLAEIEAMSREDLLEATCKSLNCQRGALKWLFKRSVGATASAFSAYEHGWQTVKEGTQELVKGAVFNALDSPQSTGFGNRLNYNGFADASTVPAGIGVELARTYVEGKGLEVLGAGVLGGVGRFASVGESLLGSVESRTARVELRSAAAGAERALLKSEKISRDLYAKLRKKTPSKEIRGLVNESIKGMVEDPALPGFFADILEADHIVAMKRIVEMPGFAQLTEDNMLVVLNHPNNFIGLTKSANASKGAKDWFEWTVHKKTGVKVRPEFAAKMQRKQLKLEQELQSKILQLLREQ